MKHSTKWFLRPISLLLIPCLFFYLSCRPNKVQFQTINGHTMGTTYTITWEGKHPQRWKNSIDSLMIAFNQSLSTYIEDSHVSLFNASSDSLVLNLDEDPFFLSVLEKSDKMHAVTNGAFDPTVMPLVNYYGFGYEKERTKTHKDFNELDSILQLVGFEKITFYETENQLIIKKAKPGIELDFSSIAKGYGVDVIGEFFKDRNIENFMIEIGGEVVVRGRNPQNNEWTIGINTPDVNASSRDILLPVILKNQALATSGNYRNFYIEGDNKYTHIINPITGKTTLSDILSASIVAPDCATADALATACIVLGLQRSMELIESLDEVEACFITPGIDNNSFEILFSKGLKSPPDE